MRCPLRRLARVTPEPLDQPLLVPRACLGGCSSSATPRGLRQPRLACPTPVLPRALQCTFFMYESFSPLFPLTATSCCTSPAGWADLIPTTISDNCFIHLPASVLAVCGRRTGCKSWAHLAYCHLPSVALNAWLGCCSHKNGGAIPIISKACVGASCRTDKVMQWGGCTAMKWDAGKAECGLQALYRAVGFRRNKGGGCMV